MKIVKYIADLRSEIALLAACGSICFVPTMGYLHKGHLSLVETAKKKFDFVVVSLFVNPTQFSQGEDYEKYPRDLKSDSDKCLSGGVDILYTPDVAEMYPEGFSVSIDIGPAAKEMCGKSRVNYFNGIMCVVAKLLLRVCPSAVIFGEKDYQMFFLIKKFLQDMDFNVQVLFGDTVREDDSLAYSSRNVYLSEEEREIAPYLYKTLHKLKDMLLSGMAVSDATKYGNDFLSKCGFNVDYLEIRSEASLMPLQYLVQNARIFGAAYLGNCRLIDNIRVEL